MHSTPLLQCLTLATQYSVLCGIFHLFVSVSSATIIPGFTSMSKENQQAWHNKAVSTIHAMVMFYRAAYYWVKINPQMELLETVSAYQGNTIDVMVGYLIYDTFYELAYGKSKLMMGHHLAGLLSHLTTRGLANGPAAFYSMIVYLAELSTPFLNLSWLLKQLEPRFSTALTICGVTLVFTFFFCRVLLGPYMLYHMFNYWTTGPAFLYHLNFAIIAFFILMNYYWFYQLVKILFKPSKGKKKANNAKASDDKLASDGKKQS